MPFAKRIVEPQWLCRRTVIPTPSSEPAAGGGEPVVAGESGASGDLLQAATAAGPPAVVGPLEDLVGINNLALSRTLRQLSDLARHACSIFTELETEVLETHRRVRGLQGRIGRLQDTTAGLDPKQQPVPVSNLDVESKLSRHYSAPWPQQRNILHPSSRPPCVEELHRCATLSLLQRDHQQRRAICRERRVTIAVSVAPPMPSYPSPRTLRKRGRTVTTAVPTDSDGETVPTLGQRSKVPVPNVPTTLDKQTNWTRALPLPTPEERMKTQTQVSCVIPINVTGLGFDRDASVRCSLVHSQSVLQRRRKLRRRKTVAGIPRQVPRDLDSDDSPGSRERTVIVHASLLDSSVGSEELASRLSSTKDSGCQTEDFLISGGGGSAARRRIRAQRGGLQGVSASLSLPLSLSYSAGNICSLPGDDPAAATDHAMFNGARLRSRSLPREGSSGRLAAAADESRRRSRDGSEEDDDDDEDDEELSRFDAEDFLSVAGSCGTHQLKDEEGRSLMDGAVPPELQYHRQQLEDSPEHHGWMESRGRSRRGMGGQAVADMLGSQEMSSSSDTFSSPVHSSASAGVPGLAAGQMLLDHHKEDHQSSSGNWSGSSSTCPSQTSETTLPPGGGGGGGGAASPHLTGSSHCDSELSLNAALAHHGGIGDNDCKGFLLADPYHPGMRTLQRAESFSSAAMDLLEDAGVGTASDGEWSGCYPHPEDPLLPPNTQDFSPEPPGGGSSLREAGEGSLGCPSFASMATYESSYSDTRPPSEKADTVSHYSVDTEGYYTSMHFDCGLKESKSFTYNHYNHHNHPHHPHTGSPDPTLGAMDSLSRRCLSLRRPRGAKPSPPQRSSSLRKICSEGNLLLQQQQQQQAPEEEQEKREPKICCGQTLPLSAVERKLQLNLAAGGSFPLRGPPHHQETLFLGRRSGEPWAELPENNHGSITAGLFGSADGAHSFKDEGAVRSDYADLWLLGDLKSGGGGGAASDPYRSLSNSSTATGTTVVECGVRSTEGTLESQTTSPLQGSRATTPSLPAGDGVGDAMGSVFKLASPEKLAGLASPSSGYSSQSETPTSSCFTAGGAPAFFPSPLSPPPPGGKRKPKVPERKSSLSSLSSNGSSTPSSSKRELELPVIPPSHLDLSALQHHASANKPSQAHRNHHHLLHQSKPKVAAKKKPVATPPCEVPGGGVRYMAITPTVLHAVQLRSVSRAEPECSPDKVCADVVRAACPAVNPAAATVLSASRSLDFKASPQLYRSYPPHSASAEFYEPLFIGEEEEPTCVASIEAPPCLTGEAPPCLTGEARSKQDQQEALAPPPPPEASENTTELTTLQADQSLSEQDFSCRLDGTELAETATSSSSTPPHQEGEVSLEDLEEGGCPLLSPDPVSPLLSPGDAALETDSSSSTPPRPEPSEDQEPSWCASDEGSPPPPPPPPPQSDDAAQRCDDGLDEVTGCQSQETSEAAVGDGGDRDMGYESSGVSSSSTSRDSKDGSIPDREDCCSTESPCGDTAIMSPPPSEDPPAEDNDSVFLSPTKTRTTEDLFAMIHRSKRKVLGRKDSGELSAKTRLSSSGSGAPPVTTTPPSPGSSAPAVPASPSSPASPSPASPMTPTGQQRAAGNIYRSAKKSSTSNEEFKLLLLRKGSRSEHSYRMSAAEILKSPVTPKSPAAAGGVDWLADGGSPVCGHQSPEESPPSSSPLPPVMPDLVPNNHWSPVRANGESFSPKVFHGSAASRQGRSRIPPPANSSRYGARGRVYAVAPMQAISEGEAENSDGSPHDERPSLM